MGYRKLVRGLKGDFSVVLNEKMEDTKFREKIEGGKLSGVRILDMLSVSDVEIVDREGNSEVTYSREFRNISTTPIERRVFEFHMPSPTSREEFNLVAADGEGTELETRFVEDMPSYKKFAVEFDEPLPPKGEKAMSVGFHSNGLYDLAKEEEYWATRIDKLTDRKVIRVLFPGGVGLSSAELLVVSKGRSEKGIVDSEEKNGRVLLTCEIPTPELQDQFKLVWGWD